MNEFGWSKWRRACAILLICTATAISAPAQTLTTLASFDGSNGANPTSALIQATDGNLYGTTDYFGANGLGSVFKMTPSGTLTTLYSFCPSPPGCADGSEPLAGLIQASDGNLYGTTARGGAKGWGTIFKITPGGTLTTLHSFSGVGADGGMPEAGLIQAMDGNFYGTTQGTSAIYQGSVNPIGTIFKITPGGTLTTLYGKGSGAGLIQAKDGNFYGTTDGDSLYSFGTVFKITPGGTLTTLYTFSGPGSISRTVDSSGLIQASDGNFYGMTSAGGGSQITIFKITPGGTLTTLAYLSSGGSATLIQASDGNFYGTTPGGASVGGTVFQITLGGTLTTLHSFDYSNRPDGFTPLGGLVEGTDGYLYGTTSAGGASASASPPRPGDGTIFKLSLASSTTFPAINFIGGVVSGASFHPGIAPGSWVTIFGTNLSSITDTWTNAIVNGNLPTSLDGVSVSVGGKPAYIYYVSPTQVDALAPNVGTGNIQVTVTNANGTSSATTATVQTVQPAFFQAGNYAVATTVNGTLSGEPTAPAAPSEVIILWGTGFGPTNPVAPAGVATPPTTIYTTASPVTVTVGGLPATVYSAVLAPGSAGLYQVAIQIPSTLASGTYPVIATISGAQSPSTTLITVHT